VNRRIAALLCAGALLSGCARFGLVSEAPEPPLQAAYRAPVPPIEVAGDPDTRWWEGFEDPVLTELVETALARNLDIETARLRVREARAEARVAGSRLYPTLDGSASVGGDLRSDDDGTEAEGAADALLGFNWDADLFGGLRAQRAALRAEAFRQEALRAAAALTVAADMANLYVSLRGAQLRFALAEDSLDLQQRTLQLVGERVDAGLATGLDRVRAEAAVAQLASELPPIRVEIERTKNAIAVLAGTLPGTVSARLEPPDLLRRRPDMRAAEYAIAVTAAEVGVAQAALYPRLTIPGSIGIDVGGLGAGGIVTAVVGSLSAVLDVPLFDAGARRADIDAAEARARQALVAYRQTLLDAVEAVEAALIGHAGARDRAAALRDAVAANDEAAERARSLYTQGLAGFIDVLDAQRELTDSRLALAEAETVLAQEAIALYRALGGPVLPEPGADV
jgi:multidrug efflux system outer membrane protein